MGNETIYWDGLSKQTGDFQFLFLSHIPRYKHKKNSYSLSVFAPPDKLLFITMITCIDF